MNQKKPFIKFKIKLQTLSQHQKEPKRNNNDAAKQSKTLGKYRKTNPVTILLLRFLTCYVMLTLVDSMTKVSLRLTV